MKPLWIVMGLTLSSNGFAAPPLQQVLPVVEITDDEGGRVDGSPWNSEELKGKVQVLFYVDPDVKDLNSEFSAALKEQKFPRDQFGSVAIINMAATWLPNFAIASSLKKKQEEFPHTVYVKDLKKKLVTSWNVGDDNNCVILIDRQGKVLFAKDGKLSTEEISTVIKLIQTQLASN